MLCSKLFQGSNQRENITEIAFSQFLKHVEQREVREVTIQERVVTGKLSTGERFKTYAPDTAGVYLEVLRENDVLIDAKPEEANFSLFYLLVELFPWLIIIGIWVFFMRQMQGAGGKALGFGKSKAKLLTEGQGTCDIW